ncbi:phage terminase large subunit family protein [Aquibaculum sediminis]|uniref:phage terminase large subunit family protein n=1 Tax=Aquibaculum sediminis TaxID=3231907 RepID=UPI003455EB4B
MHTDATSWADAIWRRALRPDAAMAVSAWADRHRMLSQRASAEPGRWSTERTPYLREIMDALSAASPLERVVFMKGAQLGGTEAGNNWLGYIIHQAPGPTMAVAPTVEMAKRASRQRIEPLIEESPALRALVQPARARDSGNTLLSKDFPGGVLVMTGANSAVGLRSMPARYLFLDEVDAYPPDADGEGDPVNLAIKRTSTFARRKILMVSTPTTAGLSRIEGAWDESDQRRYHVPCPDCGAFQVLRWANIKWKEIELPADQAHYACEACGSLWPEARKAWLLPRGEWRATAEGDGKTAGFHLSALYSPWFTWGEAAREFEAAGRNPHKLKVWTNTVLGETFAEASEAPDWRRLFDRREDYPLGKVPAGGLYLTAGADVQKDRIEVQVIAWGRGRENWSIDYQFLYGDPHQAKVWQQLDELLQRKYEHAGGGLLGIGRLAIDSGGHHTAEVYSWAARHPADRAMAVKGVDKASVALGVPTYVELNARGRRIKRGARLWPVGASILKSQLYGWLGQEMPEAAEPTLFDQAAAAMPEGWCHHPKAYSEEFFKQMTAERLVRRQKRNGFTSLEWELSRERNEALDTMVYAMAAALAAGLDRWSEADWAAAEAAVGVKPAAAPQKPAAPETAPARPASTAPAVVPSRWLRK